MSRYFKLLRFAWPHRVLFALIFILTLTASGFGALQPWPMKLVVDHLLKKVPMPGTVQWIIHLFSDNPNTTVLLTVFVLGGLVVYLLNTGLDIVLAWCWTLAGRRMVNDLAVRLFGKIQRRSLLFHSHNSVGDSISRVMVDSWCVYQILDTLVFTPLHSALNMAWMIFLMVFVDVKMTLIALGIAPLMVGASFLMGKPLRAAAKVKRDIETRIQSHIQQTLTGIPVVQAFAQEERTQQQFQQFADAAIQAQQRSTFLGSISGLSSGLVTTLGTGIILFVGARSVSAGTLTIGSILLFLFYLNSLQKEIKTIAGLYPTWQKFRANIDRILEVFEAEPEIAEKPNAQILTGFSKPGENMARNKAVCAQVELQNVTCGYEPDQPVLRDVSLQASAGQVIAIIGPTGAGKSTLVSLIPRFHDPWQGRVLVNGQDVRDLQLKSLRQHIAVVLQEPFLFPLSIAENIAYGNPQATRAEIEQAARLARAHDYIVKLPNGYDSVIGERGATLSGGERQRLSIARALLKNAPILILDEPTSALDAHTEGLILEALEKLMEGRTTFIIAHRLSTIRRADKIVVLKDGHIQETGTHAELMTRGEIYAHFHELQFNPHPQQTATAR